MESYPFKFKWINEHGAETGFLSRKGSLTGDILTLDTAQLPVAILANVDIRGKRLFLSTIDESGNPVHMAIAITKGSASKLKNDIGIRRSAAWAQSHKEQLQREGRGGEYRETKCVYCTATLDLTGFPSTPQVSCEFCNRIGPTLSSSVANATAEKEFRLCDECGMYSKPRKFTIFYFYFLVVIYGFWSKETWRCPGCMRGEAWKMFFGNLPFVLGVPVAVVQLFRSYGATDMRGPFRGLDGANIKARKGKTAEAIEAYNRLIAQTPTCAGVKHNIGLAFLHDKDIESAARMFEFALCDCANYRPSANLLYDCYEKLGDESKKQELQLIWKPETADEENAPPAVAS